MHFAGMDIVHTTIIVHMHTEIMNFRCQIDEFQWNILEEIVVDSDEKVVIEEIVENDERVEIEEIPDHPDEAEMKEMETHHSVERILVPDIAMMIIGGHHHRRVVKFATHFSEEIADSGRDADTFIRNKCNNSMRMRQCSPLHPIRSPSIIIIRIPLKPI